MELCGANVNGAKFKLYFTHRVAMLHDTKEIIKSWQVLQVGCSVRDQTLLFIDRYKLKGI